jgi:hypothetical protein
MTDYWIGLLHGAIAVAIFVAVFRGLWEIADSD